VGRRELAPGAGKFGERIPVISWDFRARGPPGKPLFRCDDALEVGGLEGAGGTEPAGEFANAGATGPSGRAQRLNSRPDHIVEEEREWSRDFNHRGTPMRDGPG